MFIPRVRFYRAHSFAWDLPASEVAMYEEYKLPGTNLPWLSWATRIERANEKSQLILEFLADHERFTNISNVMDLLDISESVARRQLSRLLGQGMLVKDVVMLAGRQTHLFGISAAGIKAACAVTNPRTFEAGKCKSEFAAHYLETQRIRIFLQRMSDKHVVLNEPAIRGMNPPLKHRPDLLLKAGSDLKLYPDETWAIEVELTPKAKDRMAMIVQHHLDAVERQGAYDRVLYLVPRHQLSGFGRLLLSALQCSKAPQVMDNDHYYAQQDERPKRFWVAAIESLPSPTSVQIEPVSVGKKPVHELMWSYLPEYDH
jgi:DNA-binding transcriptional ArsR family regulator